MGRFRSTPEGTIYHHSSGIHGKGYAICLTCGRADPMEARDTIPHIFEKPHRRLRGGNKDETECPGSSNNWSIQKNIFLGHELKTDVLEIQLKDRNGLWLNDRVIAQTIAIALRDALAALTGVRATELGCDVKQAKTEDPKVPICQSILIYDRFAAGYASNVNAIIEKMYTEAKRRLDCPRKCNHSCPSCILNYDQRFATHYLDRHAALNFLNSI